MTDFTRDFSPINFEEREDSIEIVLKFEEDYADKWERNSNNTFSFDELKNFLTSKEHTCYFQKQKKVEGNNKSLHKIIIPVGNNRAIEFGVRLWDDTIDTFSRIYSYSIGRSNEITFFNKPNNHTIERTCSFYCTELYEKIEKDDTAFRKLYSEVESLGIPVVNINKEKDKAIWGKYVEALKRLVKEKELVWKINKIGNSYIDKANNVDKRATYIDISIDEKDLTRQFEAEIENNFSQEELEDYAVSVNKAFIEFKNYRELSEEEKENINSIANEYFYELDKNSPLYSIEGDINFKYTEKESKEAIFSDLKKKLLSDYMLDVAIDSNGYLDISESDFSYIQKVAKDNLSNLLELVKDNSISLKINFKELNITSTLETKIESKLKENQLERAKIRTHNNRQELAIVVNAYIKPDFLEDFNFYLKNKVFIFGTYDKKPLTKIEGVELFENQYRVYNISNKKEVEETLKKLQEANPFVQIRQLPTWYIFGLSDTLNINELRNFKLKITTDSCIIP